jgi:hypothetical protein
MQAMASESLGEARKEPSCSDLLDRSLTAVRDIERFAYRAVSVAETKDEVFKARTVLQIVKGLRRKLEAWRGNGEVRP